jgi:hypothetical protein
MDKKKSDFDRVKDAIYWWSGLPQGLKNAFICKNYEIWKTTIKENNV